MKYKYLTLTCLLALFTLLSNAQGSWQIVGGSNENAPHDFHCTAFDVSTPYVAYRDGEHGLKTSVITFDGTTWHYVGPPGFSTGVAYYQNLSVVGGVP